MVKLTPFKTGNKLFLNSFKWQGRKGNTFYVYRAFYFELLLDNLIFVLYSGLLSLLTIYGPGQKMDHSDTAKASVLWPSKHFSALLSNGKVSCSEAHT